MRDPSQPSASQSNGQPGQPGGQDKPRSETHAHAEPEATVDLPPVSGLAVLIIAVLIVALFGGLFFVGFVPHRQEVARAENDAKELATGKPIVNVVFPRPPAKDPELLLPGDVAAMKSTAIHARTNGYLSELMVDIGDRVHGPRASTQPAQPTAATQPASAPTPSLVVPVISLQSAAAPSTPSTPSNQPTQPTADDDTDVASTQPAASASSATQPAAPASQPAVQPGQPLARISAPEIDAELEAARASLKQAEVVVGRATNEFNFNQGTYTRYQGLAKTGGVTQQQLDERRSAFNIANSNLKAANANVLAAAATVKRYTELQYFQTVYAPFDGVVTARNFDLGARVSASDGGAAQPLFRIEQIDTLRVFVKVPQSYVTSLDRDEPAELTVRTQNGAPIRVKGKIARTAESLDEQTRTLLVELHMPNAEGKLLPNMFGDVRFKLAKAGQPMVIPTSALISGSDGLKVAVIDGQNKASFRKVRLGRDFGVEAEIAEGVQPDERVVTNPGDRLVEGVEVQPVGPAAKPATQPAVAGAK